MKGIRTQPKLCLKSLAKEPSTLAADAPNVTWHLVLHFK
ncbi:hypothetical protein CHCC14809_0968 [Bacillus licheniformis]|nr:hypothetical protein CHCC20342_2391 [Bacillus licheniformis]TWL85462.1 hypothetical protein CHCC15292_3044 [Bacillus licheniformis]TWM71684.1 hypothetical protein CHCC14809_0968 [Bacillus licheniformis]